VVSCTSSKSESLEKRNSTSSYPECADDTDSAEPLPAAASLKGLPRRYLKSQFASLCLDFRSSPSANTLSPTLADPQIRMLRAYIDDTGDWTDDSCVVFGMVGLIGPAHEWHKLQAKWEDALECCTSPGGLHSTDLQNLTGDYSGWTTFQRERFVSLLVRVVQESMDNLRLIGSTVLMPAYKSLPKYRQQLSNPRELCALWSMLQATWQANEYFNNQEVEFIFDQRQKQTKRQPRS
jgi:hypothetical protein